MENPCSFNSEWVFSAQIVTFFSIFILNSPDLYFSPHSFPQRPSPREEKGECILLLRYRDAIFTRNIQVSIL